MSTSRLFIVWAYKANGGAPRTDVVWNKSGLVNQQSPDEGFADKDAGGMMVKEVKSVAEQKEARGEHKEGEKEGQEVNQLRQSIGVKELGWKSTPHFHTTLVSSRTSMAFYLPMLCKPNPISYERLRFALYLYCVYFYLDTVVSLNPDAPKQMTRNAHTGGHSRPSVGIENPAREEPGAE